MAVSMRRPALLAGLTCALAAGSLEALRPPIGTAAGGAEPKREWPAVSALRPWRSELHWVEVEDVQTEAATPLRQELAAALTSWRNDDASGIGRLRRARVPVRGALGPLELWWLTGAFDSAERSLLWLRNADTGERTSQPYDFLPREGAAHHLAFGDLDLDGQVELLFEVSDDQGAPLRELYLAVDADLEPTPLLDWRPLGLDPQLASTYRWQLQRELRPVSAQGLIVTTWLVDLEGRRRPIACAVADLERPVREDGSGAFELAGVDWAPGFELERFVATGSALLERDAAYFGDPLR
jgi:hypothetical protein